MIFIGVLDEPTEPFNPFAPIRLHGRLWVADSSDALRIDVSIGQRPCLRAIQMERRLRTMGVF